MSRVLSIWDRGLMRIGQWQLVMPKEFVEQDWLNLWPPTDPYVFVMPRELVEEVEFTLVPFTDPEQLVMPREFVEQLYPA